jgi:hypothetical protein
MAPKEVLTSQELIYAAKACRQSARLAEKETANPEATSMHRAFAESARILDALAAKCERIAQQMKC